MMGVEYTHMINSQEFLEAARLTHEAEALLIKYGLSRDAAHGWIRVWASRAGDGSQ